MIVVRPQTMNDLLQEFAAMKTLALEFWSRIPPERFARPFGESWSPADTVRHLIKSTVPVTRALRIPKMILRMLFGQGHGASIRYSDLVERYRAVLNAGGKAGRFSPSPHRKPVDLARSQRDLVTECHSTLEALTRALDSWSEKDLDHSRLPHPLLGKITVREMLFFTLYHYEHHIAIVAERLGSLRRSIS